ncbi:MAG TPA: hypothetical protein VKO61_00970 [Candidatus Paceibacterota bacterium]|nr:hypothetical protein [Candidatus Paceibacterota bacterium]
MHRKIKTIIAVLGVALLSCIILPHIGYSFINEKEVEEKETARTPKVLSTEVWLTAYSSSPDETDSTPFITASGERVREGIVATNFLPLNSTIQIPELFGDKIFVVKDRMHHRKTNFVDIWMPSKQEAKEFGIHETEILILSSPSTGLSLLQ